MKAKQYAKRIIDADGEQEALIEIGKIGKEFLREFIDMQKARNIQSDSGIIPLIKEFDNKFRTFAILCNQKYSGMVKPSGFLLLLQHISPNTVEFYKQNL